MLRYGLLWLVCLILAPGASSAEGLREALRQRVEGLYVVSDLEPEAAQLHALSPIQALYERRAWGPIWFDPEGRPGELQAQLMEVIDLAYPHGLVPDHYHRQRLETLLATDWESEPTNRWRERVTLELLATDAVLTLANHLAYGRVHPETIDSDWLVEREPPSMRSHLLEVDSGEGIALGSALEALIPDYPAYRDLKERLALQRALEASSDWAPIPPGPTLRPGEEGPRVAALRARLVQLGDLPDAGNPDGAAQFDEALRLGVTRFQERHGMKADGLVGSQTLAALNVSPAQRIEQLRANLERWRWLPRSLGEEYILVNIAGFDMQVVRNGETRLRQRVVVGRPYRRTPVFTGQMTYLVLNPSWEVPHKLAVQDQLPKIRENPSYLATMGFAVLQGWGASEVRIDPATVDWTALSARSFPYRLRQAPGPNNALGRVKFMFPNRHNVYLHDTPARGLFAEADRAQSSGCIRLEDPMALARWLLQERSSRLPEASLQRVLDSGVETTLRLDRPLPVHLLYWTAWGDSEGRIQYRGDIYQRDQPLIDALNAPPAPVDL